MTSETRLRLGAPKSYLGLAGALNEIGRSDLFDKLKSELKKISDRRFRRVAITGTDGKTYQLHFPNSYQGILREVERVKK